MNLFDAHGTALTFSIHFANPATGYGGSECEAGRSHYERQETRTTSKMFFLLAIVCLPVMMVNAACDPADQYRSIDGTCNNLDHHDWGSAEIAMPRLIPAMNRVTGNEPNERMVTRTFLSDPDRGKFDADLTASERAIGTEAEGRGLNSYAVIMMQFLSHDISLMNVTSFLEGGAFGITVPNCESEEDVGVSDELCATFGPFLQNKLVTRDSHLVMGSDGNVTPMNTATSYIDLNPVYGSDDHTSKNLRSGVGGKLVIGDNGELPTNDPSSGIFTENECDLFGPTDTTHMAGDARVDENFVLTTIHLLFLREHNRIADKLAAANPSWDDEKLFQESRKYNIALFQHIIYDEVLPSFYGIEATNKRLGDYEGYDPTIDPSATVEFSTACFRLHSMVNLPALFLSDTCEMSQGVILEAQTPYTKQERTNCDPEDYRRIGHADVIRGALVQHAQEYDNHVTRTLMNIRIGAPGNVDVQAANIFRGRQHMLGTIDEIRQYAGLDSVFDTDREEAARYHSKQNKNSRLRRSSKYCAEGNELECFQKLVANETLAEQMHSMYKHVDDVDPYIAMVGEVHAFKKKGRKKASSLGETATFVALDQFRKIRDGDRFWYEKDGMFTTEELKDIKKISLSDLLRENFPDLASEIPKDALQTMKSGCFETPKVNRGRAKGRGGGMGGSNS